MDQETGVFQYGQIVTAGLMTWMCHVSLMR